LTLSPAPTFLPARPVTASDLAAFTERVRRRVIRWFRLVGLIDAAAAADMLAWENSGFSVDSSVRITLIDRDVPSYFRSLEHLLRYCAGPPFAIERLSVSRSPDGRITRVRHELPRHKAPKWVGRVRGRKSTRPGGSGVLRPLNSPPAPAPPSAPALVPFPPANTPPPGLPTGTYPKPTAATPRSCRPQ
jgi:hypothetical protein